MFTRLLSHYKLLIVHLCKERAVKIIFLLLVAVCLAIWFIGAPSTSYSLVPYPYLTSKQPPAIKTEAPILIIGDKMGEHLQYFVELLQKKVSKGLTEPIKIMTLAKEGLSLPLMIQKIKSLKPLPKMTIFVGLGEELEEQRFFLEHYSVIKRNFELYDNPNLQTLLQLAPALSPYIYRQVKLYPLTQKESRSGRSEFSIKERILQYRIIEAELLDFMEFFKQRDRELIVLTNPINLEEYDDFSCAPTLDSIFEDKLNRARELYRAGDLKQAYTLVQELSLVANAHGPIHYLHAKLARDLGRRQEALRAFTLSASFACHNEGPNPVLNSIIKKVALESETLVFDFHALVYESWGKNELFKSKVYPQDLYYQKLVNVLAQRMRRMLNL